MHWQYRGRTDPVARFWSKVNKDGPVPAHCPEAGPCWLWTGRLDKDGYGTFKAWNEVKQDFWPRRATHIALEIALGRTLEATEWALHGCDNPPCVRVSPGHVHVGTHAENVQEAMDRGLIVRGEHHGNAKLTEADVRAIRASYIPRTVSYERLADTYGVTKALVRQIIKRNAWRHI